MNCLTFKIVIAVSRKTTRFSECCHDTVSTRYSTAGVDKKYAVRAYTTPDGVVLNLNHTGIAQTLLYGARLQTKIVKTVTVKVT